MYQWALKIGEWEEWLFFFKRLVKIFLTAKLTSPFGNGEGGKKFLNKNSVSEHSFLRSLDKLTSFYSVKFYPKTTKELAFPSLTTK